jgi:hypothetical protein
MKKVFCGGSRKLARLNDVIRKRADNIISEGFVVLIGDASGADKAIQQYLLDKSYKNVKVFCVGGVCRNNIGDWEICSIRSDRIDKDFEYYAIKDKKMSEEADYGFMLWDGKSKGTLNNIINLVENHKPVLVYFSPKKEFFTMNSVRSVHDLIKLCDRTLISYFEKSLNLSQRLGTKQYQLSIV